MANAKPAIAHSCVEYLSAAFFGFLGAVLLAGVASGVFPEDFKNGTSGMLLGLGGFAVAWIVIGKILLGRMAGKPIQ